MADPYLRVHAVNIYVKDQERSLDFYLNTLGFRIAFDARVGSGEDTRTKAVDALSVGWLTNEATAPVLGAT